MVAGVLPLDAVRKVPLQTAVKSTKGKKPKHHKPKETHVDRLLEANRVLSLRLGLLESGQQLADLRARCHELTKANAKLQTELDKRDAQLATCEAAKEKCEAEAARLRVSTDQTLKQQAVDHRKAREQLNAVHLRVVADLNEQNGALQRDLDLIGASREDMKCGLESAKLGASRMAETMQSMRVREVVSLQLQVDLCTQIAGTGCDVEKGASGVIACTQTGVRQLTTILCGCVHKAFAMCNTSREIFGLGPQLVNGVPQIVFAKTFVNLPLVAKGRELWIICKKIVLPHCMWLASNLQRRTELFRNFVPDIAAVRDCLRSDGDVAHALRLLDAMCAAAIDAQTVVAHDAHDAKTAAANDGNTSSAT